MANKEYSMLFKLQAQAGQEFGSTFNSAQQTMKQLQKEINQLNQTQGDISAYQKQQTAVDNTKRKLEDLQKQYDNIQKEYQETGENSSELANKMIDKQRAIDQTSQKLEQQTQKLDAMEAELKEAGVDTDNLADEQQKLAKQMDDAADEMKKVGDEADGFGEKGESAFEAVGAALVAAGIAQGLKEIAAAYKECIELSMNFHSTMSTVEALSGATAEEMSALTAQAKELGATTAFTATQAGEAMSYMGMAGWTAEQMLEGMPGVLSLAAASGEDLSLVSDIVTDSMTAFGLTAKDTSRYADILAATATNANTNVSMMGETFKVVAPLAGSLGYDVEDVAIATGILANSGVKASEAGTSLRGILTRLAKPTKESSEAMEALGISLSDDSGHMYTFMEIMEQMRDAFSGLNEEQKAFYAAELAGQRGMTGLLTIVNAAEDDFATLSDKISNCTGAAEKMAQVKLDNLKGQMTLLSSATDALKTTIGEAYDKEFQGLTKFATEMVTNINNFLSKHPVLLKSLIAITAEAGAFLAVYAAYQTYKKVSIALEPVLIALKKKEAEATAAANAQLLLNPYVAVAAAVAALTVGIIALVNAQDSEAKQVRELTSASREEYEELQKTKAEYEDAVKVYGENSEQAEYLRWRVDDLTESYEKNKQTMEEYLDAHKEAIDSINQTSESIVSGFEEIGKEESHATALIHRLQELASSTEQTIGSQEEMKAIIAALNKELPQLSLNYEDVISGQTDFAQIIDTYVKAAAAAKRYEQAQSGIVEAYNNQLDAQAQLEKDTEAQKQAWIELDKASKAYETGYANSGESLLFAILSSESQALKTAQEKYDNLTQAVEDDEEAVRNATDAYNKCYSELEGYSSATYGATEEEQRMNEAIQSTKEKLDEITASYTAAYDAALESIQGQYKLWEEAGEISTISVEQINAALESQAERWSEYQTNLDTLNAKTGEVEGLAEVIASFADGSEESMAAIAGMAQATPEELTKMVESYKTVQEAQKTTADSLADLTTQYSQKMSELQSQLESDIEKMNLSDEAAAAGKANIDAFASAAENSYTRVYNAYAAIRKAAENALNGGGGNPPPGGGGYASGTENATQGIHLVGEEGPELVYFEGGEKVLPAQETKELLSDARLAASTPLSVGGNDVKFELTINVEGDGDADGKITAAGEALMSRLEEMLNEYNSDRARRVYR